MNIYDGNKWDTTDSGTERFLKINSCGMQMQSCGRTVIRKNGRSDYHIVLIGKGSLRVKYREKTYTLNEGNLFLYEPGEPQYYESLTDSSTLWMHFAGTSIEELLTSMDIRPGIYEKRFSSRVFEEYSKLIRQFHQPKSQNFVFGTFLTLLATIADEITENAVSEGAEMIWKILSYITNHFDKRISLQQLATLSGYSKSRFSHLFSAVTGTTPITYQRNIQLQNACELLTATAYAVKDVAQSCGFEDALYFCKIFKKRYGLSPSEYRKNASQK